MLSSKTLRVSVSESKPISHSVVFSDAARSAFPRAMFVDDSMSRGDETLDLTGFLKQLRAQKASAQLAGFMSTFIEPKEMSLANFCIGVESFLRIANFTADERRTFYGSELFGLNYSTNIADLLSATGTFGRVSVSQLVKVHPDSWGSPSAGTGKAFLVYEGSKPSQALDELIKGPTAIDCGMFCQLAIWFGIRYVLGNEIFDTLFGRQALYVTQFNYSAPDTSSNPYTGSLLSSFMSGDAEIEDGIAESIQISYVSNIQDYQYKHPGGEANGQNCILTPDGLYTIFSPFRAEKKFPKSVIQDILFGFFNAPQDTHDLECLARYEKFPDQTHPHHNMSLGLLKMFADDLKEKVISKPEWEVLAAAMPSSIARFDLGRFQAWVTKMQEASQAYRATTHTPLPADALIIPVELSESIPIENRVSMCFERFNHTTEVQQKIYYHALEFCSGVIRGESRFLVLTGHPGVGKTAAAVCCAKELATRGKKVILFSEVALATWSASTMSISDLLGMGDRIREQLTRENPDVIILDDDNRAGLAGTTLLAELTQWHQSAPGRALLITSNESVHFTNCYNQYQLSSGTRNFPPALTYDSDQYIYQVWISDLEGPSLRAITGLNLTTLADEHQIDLLARCDNRSGPSAGIIIGETAYEAQKHRFGDIELIPAFSTDFLISMMRSSRETGDFGLAYHALSTQQRKWLETYQQGGASEEGALTMCFGACSSSDRSEISKPYLAIKERPFVSTIASVIAFEIEASGSGVYRDLAYSNVKKILPLLTYAHDKGGLRIILINKTGFSHVECIERLKKCIQKSFSKDAPRNIARLDALLHSPAFLSIGDDLMIPIISAESFAPPAFKAIAGVSDGSIPVAVSPTVRKPPHPHRGATGKPLSPTLIPLASAGKIEDENKKLASNLIGKFLFRHLKKTPDATPVMGGEPT